MQGAIQVLPQYHQLRQMNQPVLECEKWDCGHEVLDDESPMVNPD